MTVQELEKPYDVMIGIAKQQIENMLVGTNKERVMARIDLILALNDQKHDIHGKFDFSEIRPNCKTVNHVHITGTDGSGFVIETDA